jgi:hypothetical protein
MSNLRPPIPPVLSRQIARPIALPTRAVPLKQIPLISNAGHAQAPVRLAGGPGQSSAHIPTHSDIMSTVQAGQGQGAPGVAGVSPTPLIDLDGTFTIGGDRTGATFAQVAHLSLSSPRAVTAYIGAVKGAPQDFSGQFRLIARVSVGKGKASQVFLVDIPTYTDNPRFGGAMVALPLVAGDVDIACQVYDYGPSRSVAVLNAQDINNPTPATIAELNPPGTNPVGFTVSAFISQTEATPRARPFAGRHTACVLGPGDTLKVGAAQACDNLMLLGDPTAGLVLSEIAPNVGGTIANLPVNTILPIMAETNEIWVQNTSGSTSHFIELCQYLSFM